MSRDADINLDNRLIDNNIHIFVYDHFRPSFEMIHKDLIELYKNHTRHAAKKSAIRELGLSSSTEMPGRGAALSWFSSRQGYETFDELLNLKNKELQKLVTIQPTGSCNKNLPVAHINTGKSQLFEVGETDRAVESSQTILLLNFLPWAALTFKWRFLILHP